MCATTFRLLPRTMRHHLVGEAPPAHRSRVSDVPRIHALAVIARCTAQAARPDGLQSEDLEARHRARQQIDDRLLLDFGGDKVGAEYTGHHYEDETKDQAFGKAVVDIGLDELALRSRKAPEQPDEGIPFDTDDAMFNPPVPNFQDPPLTARPTDDVPRRPSVSLSRFDARQGSPK